MVHSITVIIEQIQKYLELNPDSDAYQLLGKVAFSLESLLPELDRLEQNSK